MRRKIILHIVLLVSLFLFNNNAFADNTCTCNYSSDNLVGSFIVDKSTSLVTNNKIRLVGEIANSTDSSSHDIDKSYTIDNWKKKYSGIAGLNFDFIGKDYFSNDLLCPSRVYVVDLVGSYGILVSNGKSENIETKANGMAQGMEILTLQESSTCNGHSNVGSANNDSSDSAFSCYDYNEDNCNTEEKIQTPSGEMEKKYSCVWVTGDNTPGYCNVDKLQYVKCGDAFDIPEQAPRIMSFAINLLKIGTPIILIITGIITLVKALAASKEDEIKKATSTLIRKLIASAFVFFVIMIVQFVILKVADSSETGEISKCLSCFLNNDCSSSVYFKTKVGDSYTCHLVSNPSQVIDCGENVPLDE